ncbi:hypothetical protein MNBD_GAMMA06-456 [hydrothermal vent metagenome]|uniref:PEP-CTERM protein-sorting domain-containing protein n=1 Tax=hydrothermal vent metagenome TaxID=652676 RepID=A0A3B0WPE1_9ZZZZ
MNAIIHAKTKLTAAIVLALGSTTANALHLEMFEIGNTNSNFTMLNPGGGPVGGTNLVKVMWDGTLNTSVETADINMTISSTDPFFGAQWFARDVQVFGAGTYTFDACPGPANLDTGKAADGSSACSVGNTPLTLTVGEGQVGAHMLFDWNSSVSIDVINVWDLNSAWGFGPNDGSITDPDAAVLGVGTSVLQTAGTDCVVTGKNADPTSKACTDFFATEWLFASTTTGDGSGIPGAAMIDGPFGGFKANFNIGPKVVPVPAAVWLMGSGLLGLVGVARRKQR